MADNQPEKQNKTGDADTVEVALFPIPDVVAFPGTALPLHVFEPRYRQLVHDCVRDQRMVGVSHVVKAIHKPNQSGTQTPEEMLSSNQTTYKPRQIFSAGQCEVLQTLDDGRLLAKINVSQRLALLDDVQSLPYRIVRCSPVQDEASSATLVQDQALMQSINERLIEIVKPQSAELAEKLDSPAWMGLQPAQYSFQIFEFLRFDADVMQQILEMQNVNARLETIWSLLRQR
ncbi:MAG: LON peptidase substrate-binding domain-containing protein [Pseudomonadota bacterium]